MSFEKYLIVDNIADINPPTIIPDKRSIVDDPFLNNLDTTTVKATVKRITKAQCFTSTPLFM